MSHIKHHLFKAVFIASMAILPFIAVDSMAAVAANHSDNSLVADRGGGWGGRGGGGNGWSGRKASSDRSYDRGSYDRGDYNRGAWGGYDRGWNGNRGYDYDRGYNGGGGVYFNMNPDSGYYYNQTPNGIYNYDSQQ